MDADFNDFAAFWRYFTAAQNHEGSAAERWLVEALRLVDTASGRESELRRELVRSLARDKGVQLPDTGDQERPASAGLLGQVSLVTACRNRNENLLKALPSWLDCPQIGEVIIVDWTSQSAVRSDLDAAGLNDERIRVIRVEGEPRWVLSRAFNVGFQHASLPYILKADADIVLAPGFFEQNPRPVDSFVAGNWRNAAAGQSFVNGFFFIERERLLAAGGFNEFITSYGWDDEELYARLMLRGAARVDVTPETINHLPHDDFARTQEVVEATQPAAMTLQGDTLFLTRRNRFISVMMPEWSSERARSTYRVLESEPVHERDIRLELEPTSLTSVPDAVIEASNLCAARELMGWHLGELALELPLHKVEALIKTHAWDALTLGHVREALEAKTAPVGAGLERGPAAKLFVDAQHGLGNRLRAIASAAAVAKAEGRELVIVWRPDDHCSCRFEDLFEYDGAVVDKGEPATLLDRAGVLVNYMEIEAGAQKDARVNVDPSRPLYFRSAYVMNHQASGWDAENAFLRSLRPVEAVRDLVASVRHPNEVSVHIRMGSGPDFEHLPWESSANWSDDSHRELAQWREKSHVSRFEKRLDQFIDEGRADTIFLAADLPETYERLLARYPGRLVYLSRPVNDRSLEQLRYALADAILLGQSKLLLGSTWSSFTELALRLSTRPPTREMSGTDF